MKRAKSLADIKKILTLGDKHGVFVQNIDGLPNKVGYSGNHSEGYVFMQLEITPSGKASVLGVKSEVSAEYSENILDIVLDMIAIKE
jgi:hypothetical protein